MQVTISLPRVEWGGAHTSHSLHVVHALTNSFAVGFHRHGEVLQFQIFMTKEDPCTLVTQVHLDGHLKVSDSLFMFASQTVEVGWMEGKGGEGSRGGEAGRGEGQGEGRGGEGRGKERGGARRGEKRGEGRGKERRGGEGRGKERGEAGRGKGQGEERWGEGRGKERGGARRGKERREGGE